jgi:hypothetical protein
MLFSLQLGRESQGDSFITSIQNQKSNGKYYTLVPWLQQDGKESKAVPLHAMKAPGGRGGIAPTHS